jgi:hypothetical protein
MKLTMVLVVLCCGWLTRTCVQVNKLVPSPGRSQLSPMLSHVRHGLGGVSVYVGLNK